MRLYDFVFSLSKRLFVFKRAIFSFWIKKMLGEVGQNVSVYYPCHLEGSGYKNIRIGDNTVLNRNCILGCWERFGTQIFTPSITIGENCIIGEYCQISSINRIVIGDGLLTGRFVYIGDNAHGTLSVAESTVPPVKRNLSSKGPITIGKNVWIGDKVSILGGVNIGDNVIIGSNSVVTHSVPSNCIVAGSPAVIRKQL